VREINPRIDRPFVAKALAFDRWGNPFLDVVGIVFGRNEYDAREEAVTRWPDFTLPTPELLDGADEEDRKNAFAAEDEYILQPQMR